MLFLPWGDFMLERQYCASAFTIDFDNKEVLLVYNRKLKKWLQPGGHIEGLETPIEAAIRETFEETGIDIQIIGPSFFDGFNQPIAAEHYINKVGDMIDLQYVAIPLHKTIHNLEGNEVKWVSLEQLKERSDISEEIKVKVLSLYQTYKQ